jgi:hypothetical protein
MTKDEALKMCLEYIETNAQGSKFAILIKEALAQPERDYERGVIDGRQMQMQSSVDKAVNAMTQPTYYIPNKDERTWVGLTDEELQPIADEYRILFGSWVEDFARAIEAKLKEKNNG